MGSFLRDIMRHGQTLPYKGFVIIDIHDYYPKVPNEIEYAEALLLGKWTTVEDRDHKTDRPIMLTMSELNGIFYVLDVKFIK